MSKGRKRGTRAALANLTRSPESWRVGPVIVTKHGKNRVLVNIPVKRGERRAR